MTPQRTIKDSIVLEGVGLQTGKRTRLNLNSAPENSGINFIRADLAGKPSVNLRSLDLGASLSSERRTTLGSGALQIQTTEHLLAALSGLGIDNITAELDGEELPGGDGSAKIFVDAIKNSGVAEQGAVKKILKIKEPVWCARDGSLIAILPDEVFRVSYTLAYESPAIGTQYYDIAIDENSFIREIAPARTFCLEEEAAGLLRMGLGKGANYDNTLVMGKNGPIKTVLRFPDEPVRHKILDLIGDLYILGTPILGHVVAIKSGHSLNMELVKKLKGE